MIEPASFQNIRIRGGFTLVRLEFIHEPLIDAIGREAIARTRIIDRPFFMTIRAGLSDAELSVTIYHEVLEGATVAVSDPPESVRMLNQGDFERAAYQAHQRFGEVSPENLNQILQFYGF